MRYFRRLLFWIFRIRLRAQYHKAREIEDPVERVEAVISLPLFQTLESYTPKVGGQVFAHVIHQNADTLIRVLESARISVTNLQPVETEVLRLPNEAIWVSVDDYLADDRNFGIDILDFYTTATRLINALVKDLNNLEGGNKAAYLAYRRKLTHVFRDVSAVWEALVQLALSDHVRRYQ